LFLESLQDSNPALAQNDMKFILGTKEYMTQVFDDAGRAFPATVISAGPIVVTQVKSKESDGYEGVQVGFGEQKESRLSKAVKGHLKTLGNFRHLGEFRTDVSAMKVGDKIDLSNFKAGEKISVRSESKGKGFQGVVKRHHFKGGSRTHGQKHSEREPGTISGGGGRAGGRVAKGMRMAGRMGGEEITVKNLAILQVDPATNTLVLKGSIPGKRGTLIRITAK
jgi:large subunit ribosomal protein L3